MDKKQAIKAALIALSLGAIAVTQPTVGQASGCDCDFSNATDCSTNPNCTVTSAGCCDAEGNCCQYPGGVLDPNSCRFSVTTEVCGEFTCCCDSHGGNCNCSQGVMSCSSGQMQCCSDKNGWATCPNGMSFHWNPCNPPQELVEGICACAGGKVLYNGACVEPCQATPCDASCPKPCSDECQCVPGAPMGSGFVSGGPAPYDCSCPTPPPQPTSGYCPAP